MRIPKINLVLGLFILFIACSQPQKEESEKSAAVADNSNDSGNSIGFVSSSAAVENGKDSTRRFIRTAELKFKVKSVIKSTYDIEDITNRQGGFVSYTNLSSTINNVTTTAVSADSTLETTYYTVTNSIQIRIPNTKLDTTLKEISRNIDYLDYRIIKAEDVALKILANDLTQKRTAKSQERLSKAIDKNGAILNDKTNAEELLLSKQEQSDDANIANLSLTDQIKFSTIDILIYQRETFKRELILNDKKVEAYDQSFGGKIWESFKYGWDILEAFLVFLTKLWGLFLFAILTFILYKRFGHRFK